MARKFGLLSGVASCVMALAAVPQAAVAQTSQTSGGGKTEEGQASEQDLTGRNPIIVTARKRSETLQEVPVAVTAFSSDEIAASGARNLQDLAYLAPGVQFNSQALSDPSRSFTRIRFRGMDLNTTPNPTQEIASVFIDGVYTPGSVSSIPIADLERVEIIRGPQSALFGRATFGGAVNYITQTPGNDFMGRFTASAAEDEDYELTLAIEGPLIEDVLFFRAGGRLYSFDGQYRSGADGGKLGEQQTTSGFLTLYATPGPDFEAKLDVRYFEDEDGPAAGYFLGKDLRNCGPFTDPNVEPGPAFSESAFFCGDLPVVDLSDRGPNTALTPDLRSIFIDNDTEYAPFDEAPKLESFGLARESFFTSLDLSYTLPSGITIGSITGYAHEEVANFRDFDLTPANAWYVSGPQQSESFSQELRIESSDLNRFSWAVGASYFNQSFSVPDANGLFALFVNDDPFLVVPNPVGTFNVETYAAFGAFTYDITDRITINVEARYQEDNISQETTTPNTPILKETYRSFLPRVIVEFQPTADTNLYLTYAEGNRPGGFNPEVLAATDDVRQQLLELSGATINIEEEDLVNYEAGIKQTFGNGRGFFNLAGYYMEWTNQQSRFAVPVFDPGNPASDPTGTRVVQVVVNAGVTDLWGIEAEAGFEVTPELTLNGQFAWAASEYQEFLCIFCARITGNPDVSGNSVPRFPEFSGSASGTYIRPVTDSWDWMLRADAIYFGEAFVEESNLANTDDYWLVNLRTGFQKEDFSIEVFVTNLLDNDDYLAASRQIDFSNGFDFTQQGVVVTPARRRQVGIRASLTFR